MTFKLFILIWTPLCARNPFTACYTRLQTPFCNFLNTLSQTSWEVTLDTVEKIWWQCGTIILCWSVHSWWSGYLDVSQMGVCFNKWLIFNTKELITWCGNNSWYVDESLDLNWYGLLPSQSWLQTNTTSWSLTLWLQWWFNGWHCLTS